MMEINKMLSWQPVSKTSVQTTLPDGRTATVYRVKGKQSWKVRYPPNHEYGPWATQAEATRAVDLWARSLCGVQQADERLLDIRAEGVL